MFSRFFEVVVWLRRSRIWMYLVLEALELDGEFAEAELVVLGVPVFALEGDFGVGDLLELGAEVGDGLVDVALDLLVEDVKGVGEVDHLRVALEVAFAEDGLLLAQLGPLLLEGGDGAVGGDVGDLEEVAALGLNALDLLEEHLEVEALESDGGEGGVDGAKAVGDDVDAGGEGDEVVAALVFLEAAFGGLGLEAELLGAAAEVFDGELVFAADVLDEVVDELAGVAVGDDRGALGVAVLDGDGDEETVAEVADEDVADEGAGGGRGAALGDLLLVGALEDLDLLGGEGLHDGTAEAVALEDAEVGVEIDLGADGGINDLLVEDDAFGALELHRGGGAKHRGLARLPVAVGEGNEQRNRQRNPKAFAEDDEVVAERAALDGVLLVAVE
jgi:hypothetical protein